MSSIWLLLAIAGAVHAAEGPSFEVASIKAAEPIGNAARFMAGTRIGCGGGPGTTSPGAWICANANLNTLIVGAFQLQRYQFTPEPWMASANFDITAKVPAGTTREQFQQMKQNLLAERFKLTFHREPKEGSIYELSVAKGGLKMKETPPEAGARQDDGQIPKFTLGADGYPAFPEGSGGWLGVGGKFRWKGRNVTVAELIDKLSSQFGRLAVDTTGLKGGYDINMYWIQESMDPEPDAEDTGPTLIRALQDQLGLKLDSKKGTFDVFVIDHLEKTPTEN